MKPHEIAERLKEAKPHQKAMIEDGCPPLCVLLTAEERKQAWADSPPRKLEWNMTDNKSSSLLEEAKQKLNDTAKESGVKPVSGKLDGKKAAAKAKEVSEAAKKKAASKPKPEPTKAKAPKADIPKGASTKFEDLALQFQARPGSNKEKALKKLASSFGKVVSKDAMLKAIYGSENASQSALDGVMRGFKTAIEKNKLPYNLAVKDGGYAIEKK